MFVLRLLFDSLTTLALPRLFLLRLFPLLRFIGLIGLFDFELNFLLILLFRLGLVFLLLFFLLSLSLNFIIFTNMTLVQVERIEINEIDAALSFTGTNTDIADVHIVLIGVLERVENLDVAWLLLLCVMPLGYLGLV